LLSMDKLWAKRKPPTPLCWDSHSVSNPQTDSPNDKGMIKDQHIWSSAECIGVMVSSLKTLYQRFQELEGTDSFLVWDKDDDASMDFVTATANLRSLVFSIPPKSRFDVKSMAGNIIPAIATTNAVIAGLIVFEAFKILEGKFEECKHIYLNSKPNALNKVISPSVLDVPNPKCYVCSPKPEVTVLLNVTQMTVLSFQEKILRASLNMISPDVMIDDGKGTVLLSSEEDETEDNLPKLLSAFNIVDGTRLRCEDFHQEYNLNITIAQRERLEDGSEFSIIADASLLQPQVQTETADPQPSTSNAVAEASSSTGPIEIDDDLNVVFHNGESVDYNGTNSDTRKRSIEAVSETTETSSVPKKPRISVAENDVIEL